MAWYQLTYPNVYATLMVHDYLLPELRSVTSVDQFRSQLKTYLFKLAYDV